MARKLHLLSEVAADAFESRIADKRLDAMDELNIALPVLGMLVSARLTDYCASGLTAAQIGKKHGINKGDVAVVLEQDLVACAKHFRFV